MHSSVKLCNAVVFIAADVQIQQPLQNLRHVEKETAVLKCQVKNPQKYPVKWFRGDEEIVPDGKKWVVWPTFF